MPSYSDIKAKQTELVRKSLEGSVFVASDPPPATCLHEKTEEVVIAPGLVVAGIIKREVVANLCTECLVDVRTIADTTEVRAWGSMAAIRTVNEARDEAYQQRRRIEQLKRDQLEVERKVHAELDAAGL